MIKLLSRILMTVILTASIAFAGLATEVDLTVYNLLGQKVTTLAKGNFEAGSHAVTWDASEYSSGIYFYKLTVADKVITKRMTLLK